MTLSLSRKALGLALGEVVAEVRREFRAEAAAMAAEGRALVAELKALVVTLDREVREKAAAATAAELDVLRSAVAGMIEKAEAHVAGLPMPKDGEPGRDAELPDIEAMVGAAISKAVDGLPRPEPPPVAKAIDLADALIDNAGNLVLTLSNGAIKVLGRVVGRDVDEREMQDAIVAAVKSAVDAFPRPRDGIDGLGFDDLDIVEHEDGFHLRFARGDVVKEFYLPITIDRGVFRKEQAYRRGHSVSYGGSLWIAQKDAPEGQPESSPDWRLSTKRGRDGREVVKMPREANEPVKV